jgi:hypothetical protein
MTKIKNILLIILATVIVVLLWKSCNHVAPPNYRINVDSILNSITAEEVEIATLKDLASGQTDTIYKERHHYHTIRKDSLITCEDKLVICDTIIIHDSIHDITQDLIIAKQDTVIQKWHLVHSVDSASIAMLSKENRRLKRKNRWLSVLNVVQAGLNGFQAVKN